MKVTSNMKKLSTTLLLLLLPISLHATTLTLGWDDTINNTAVKYRMYRQLSCTGSYVVLGESIYPNQTFLDTNFSIATYCYKVTGIDSAEVESGPSNILTVTCKHGPHQTITCTGV